MTAAIRGAFPTAPVFTRTDPALPEGFLIAPQVSGNFRQYTLYLNSPQKSRKDLGEGVSVYLKLFNKTVLEN
jgi:hypothetical protein